MTQRKLDQPLGGMDDWDLLQAAYELGAVETKLLPPKLVDDSIIEAFFPLEQSKYEQVRTLKKLITTANTTAEYRKIMETSEGVLRVTPKETLEECLRRLNLQRDNFPESTPRSIWNQYLEATTLFKGKESNRIVPKYLFFVSDLWDFLANKKLNNENLFTLKSDDEKNVPVSPAPQDAEHLIQAKEPSNARPDAIKPENSDEEILIIHGIEIHLDYKRKNIICGGKTLTQDRLFQVFVTLKDHPDGSTKDQLLMLWDDERSDNPEARLIEAMSKLRRFFNNVKPGFGTDILPDARKNSGLYILAVSDQIIPI